MRLSFLVIIDQKQTEARLLIFGVLLHAVQDSAALLGKVARHPITLEIGCPDSNDTSGRPISVFIPIKISRVEGRKGTVAACDAFRVNGDPCIIYVGLRILFVGEADKVHLAVLRIFDGDFQPIGILRVNMPALLDRELEHSVVRYLIVVIVSQKALLDELQAAERLDVLSRLTADRGRDRALRDGGVGIELAVIRGGRVEPLRVIEHRIPVVTGNSGKDVHSGAENVDGGFSVIGEARRLPRDIRRADSDHVVASRISRMHCCAVVVRCVVGCGYIADHTVLAQNRDHFVIDIGAAGASP